MDRPTNRMRFAIFCNVLSNKLGNNQELCDDDMSAFVDLL